MAARYEKREADGGLWRVIDVDTGRVVLLDGMPLDGMEQREADEAIELLEANEVTPDVSESP